MLDSPYHNICDLFEQLGIGSDEASMNAFFDKYGPIPNDIDLWEAPCWNRSQADFLHEALKGNADWQVAVDELNTRLRNANAV